MVTNIDWCLVHDPNSSVAKIIKAKYPSMLLCGLTLGLLLLLAKINLLDFPDGPPLFAIADGPSH
jgi:hypothetical protein